MQPTAFRALKVWEEVYSEAKRFHPPAQLPDYPMQPFPAPRYLPVGTDWDEGAPRRYSGMRSWRHELADFDAGASHRELQDGRQLLRMQESALFDVDEQGAQDFFAFEAERVLTELGHESPEQTFFYYASLGVLSTAKRHQSTLDGLLRRAAYKRRHGLCGELDSQALLERTIAADERAAWLQERQPKQRLVTDADMPLRYQLCEPVELF